MYASWEKVRGLDPRSSLLNPCVLRASEFYGNTGERMYVAISTYVCMYVPINNMYIHTYVVGTLRATLFYSSSLIRGNDIAGVCLRN